MTKKPLNFRVFRDDFTGFGKKSTGSVAEDDIIIQ